MDPITSFANSSTAWLPALAESTLRTSLILLASGAIAFGMRSGPAALRHMVWVLALAGVLLAPIAATYLPPLGLPLPSFSPLRTTAAAPAPTLPGLTTVAGPTSAESPPLSSEQDISDVVPVGGFAATRTLEPAAPAPGRFEPAEMWALTLFGLWSVGALALLLRMGVGLRATHRLGQTAEPPRDPEWRALATELADQLGLARSVRVLSSPRAAMPMTWGWTRPVVLVPSAGRWPTDRKRVVLLHELSHVKRCDCAWQSIANLALSVHWFNPLVWLAVRGQRVERERACDDAVLHAGTPASAYADHLLEIARTHREPRWSAIGAVAMASRSQLEGRLLSILAPGRPARMTPATAVAIIAMMTLVTASLAAVTPSARLSAGQVTVPAVGLPERPAALQTAPLAAPPAPQAPAPPTTAEPALDQASAELREMLDALSARAREQSRAADEDALDLAVRGEEVARELGDLDLLIDGVAITEDLRARIRQELGTLQARISLDRSPLDPRVVDLLLGSLSDEDPEVRERAARGLGRNQVSTSTGALSAALRDSDADVRRAAAWALGRLRARTAVGPLASALDDADPAVRVEVVEALGQIRDVAAVAPLVGALADGEARIRREAAEALGRLRHADAVDGLVTTLADTNLSVVRHAVEALGRIRDPSAVPGLLGALQHADSRVVAGSAEALGRIRSDEAVDGLAAALGTAEDDAAQAIVLALGRIGGDRSLEALIAVSDGANPAVRKAVIDALSRRRWGPRSAPSPSPNPEADPNRAAAPEPE